MDRKRAVCSERVLKSVLMCLDVDLQLVLHFLRSTVVFRKSPFELLYTNALVWQQLHLGVLTNPGDGSRRGLRSAQAEP